MSTSGPNSCVFSEPLQPQGWSSSALCAEMPLKSVGRTEISSWQNKVICEEAVANWKENRSYQ